MSKKNQEKNDLDFIRLFHTTFKEFEKISSSINFLPDEEGYIGEDERTNLKIKLMLLRKYITNGETVQLKSIVEKLKTLLPQKTKEIDRIYDNFKAKSSEPMIHINARGEEQDIRDVFQDMTYGYFLHADFDRVDRLRNTDENLLWVMIKKYVSEIEEAIIDIDGLIVREIQNVEQVPTSFASEPVVRYADVKDNEKGKLQGRWRNLIAQPMSDDYMLEGFEGMNQEDIVCWLMGTAFLTKLNESSIPSPDEMRTVVLEDTISDWGDFSDIQKEIQSLGEYGLSTRVDYNNDGNVAWLKVFPDVREGFVVSVSQQVNVYYITLVRDDYGRGDWKVFAFGGKVTNPFKID